MPISNKKVLQQLVKIKLVGSNFAFSHFSFQSFLGLGQRLQGFEPKLSGKEHLTILNFYPRWALPLSLLMILLKTSNLF